MHQLHLLRRAGDADGALVTLGPGPGHVGRTLRRHIHVRVGDLANGVEAGSSLADDATDALGRDDRGHPDACCLWRCGGGGGGAACGRDSYCRCSCHCPYAAAHAAAHATSAHATSAHGTIAHTAAAYAAAHQFAAHNPLRLHAPTVRY
jgi:hypothetical protein